MTGEMIMNGQKLTRSELIRLQRAADNAGFPWQAIAKRPNTARRFIRRMEAAAGQAKPEGRAFRLGGPGRLLREIIAARRLAGVGDLA